MLHLAGVVLPDGAERDVFATDDGRFTFDSNAPGTGEARTVAESAYLTPGLADVHCHLSLASPAPPTASPEEAARASARMELAAGVLAIREPGSPWRASIGIGPDEGLPRTFTGGQFLAPPGGYVPGFPREVSAGELADAALDELRASGAWVKVVGDWAKPGGGWGPNFPPEALAEAARRVHAAGGRIAIHATIGASIDAAIEAGFDSIEHGPGITGRQIDGLANHGIAWVPTMGIIPAVGEFVASLGVDAGSFGEALDRHPEAVREAAEAGVRLLAGTDAGMAPHGSIANEIRLLAGTGMGPAAALAAGSWDARAFLGLPGIEEGAPADLVAYARDPREDLAVLDEPILIVLDGTVVAGPASAG